MILLFDVGNTNISFSVTDGQHVTEIYRLNTVLTKTADEYYMAILPFIKDVSAISDIAISSVVPRVTEQLKEISRKFFNVTPLVVEMGVKTGIQIKTDHPAEVGSDLICAAAAVSSQNKPTLIIDMGTATKYIYVRNKTILGVIITPGVRISVKALVGHTALLPDINIEVPKKVLGTNTITCMQSGVTYGVAAQVDGLIERIKHETKEAFDVILTGGLSGIIAPLCYVKNERIPELVLEGLLLIYQNNRLK